MHADAQNRLDTQLKQAAETGDLHTVRVAFEAGADLHTSDDYALRHAAANGHLDVVKQLVEWGADLHANREYALWWAAHNGHAHVVAFLLAAGADVHADDGSALQVAAREGHVETLKQLLAAGAGVHIESLQALYWALNDGHLPAARLLRAHGAKLDPVMAYIHAYSSEKQRALFDTGDVADLSVIDLAKQGVCTEALCVLLERQGQAELATMISATRMLEPLDPAARATLLEELLGQAAPGLPYVRP